MNKLAIIIIIVVIILIICINYNQKEGFWSWNYWGRSTPCVEDVFGNMMCDPSFNYLYPNYYYYSNPFLYNSPEMMYRRIMRY